MIRKCEMTMMDSNGPFDFYYLCGKPAKYRTPKDLINPNRKRMIVCGIHKNSVDAMYRRIGAKERCEVLEDD